MKEENSVTRRDAMKIAIWTIAGLMGTALGIPAIAYIVGPSLQRDDEQDWVKLGSASKVELGVLTLFKANITRKAGWITAEEQIAAFVLTEDGREYIAMSNICTHLGCRVRWIQDRERFLILYSKDRQKKRTTDLKEKSSVFQRNTPIKKSVQLEMHIFNVREAKSGASAKCVPFPGTLRRSIFWLTTPQNRPLEAFGAKESLHRVR